MKKSIALGIAVLASLSLAACGNSATNSTSASSSSNSSSSISSKEPTVTKKTTTEKDTSEKAPVKKTSTGVTMENYKAIKVALSNGGDATDEAKVKELFGKPDESTKTTVPGLSKEATEYSWTKVGKGLTGATITVSFYDGKAVGKGYSDAELTPNNKINTSVLSSIKKGDSLDSVESKLGMPNTEAISGAGDLSAQTIDYTSVKGSSATSVGFGFSNNKLISTTKVGI